jgi:hypothetical protein
MAQMAEYLATLNPPAPQQRFNRNHQRTNRNDRYNTDRTHRNRGTGRPSYTANNNQPQSNTPSGCGGRAS